MVLPRGVDHHQKLERVHSYLYRFPRYNHLDIFLQAMGALLNKTCDKGNWKFSFNILDEIKPQENGQPYESLITFVKDRPGHDLRYAIDASKIANELNWTPTETFDSGIRKTVEWYLNNMEWCSRVQDGSYQRERLGAGE